MSHPGDRPTVEPDRQLGELPDRPGLSDGAPLSVQLGPVDLRVLEAALAPLRTWSDPRFFGLDNIPDSGPVLLVANHNLLGLIDAPLLLPEVLRHRGRLIRGLAENLLIRVPGVRHFLHYYGSVRGTRENCRTLLEQGEVVLVFPGGGREAIRRKGEKYALRWEGRTGFARMAIECGVPIVPVAMIGIDDAFDIIADKDDVLLRPLRALVEALGIHTELTPPLLRGIGLSPIPRPERFYFSAGTAIDPGPWRETGDIDEACGELAQVVEKALREELTYLLGERDRDRGRTLSGRLRELLPV
ncbi:lysophospholipid acyltransferase family protein [Nocardia sp. NPDC003345]